jgi:hypothetical protein
MQIPSGQGGLLQEGLALLRPTAVSQAPPDLLKIMTANHLAIVERLWTHWLVAPAYIDTWVPNTSDWPREVQETSVKGKGKLDEDAMRAWRGRLAVLASLGSPPRLPQSSSAPPISRPRRMDQLLPDLTALRALVKRDSVLGLLRKAFGSGAIDPYLAGTSIAAPSIYTFGQAVRVAIDAAGTAPTDPRSVKGFDIHLKVREVSRRVLEDDLPFDQLQAPLSKVYEQLDRFENTMVEALDPSISVSHAVDPSLFPLGLFLSAVARAYFTEVIAGFALASLPIQTLYWTPPDLSGTTVSGPRLNARVKKFYTAYTAVALWEAWTNRAVPHVDQPSADSLSGLPFSGHGYLVRHDRLPITDSLGVAASSIANGFDDHWRDNAPRFHRTLVTTLKDMRARLDWIPQASGPPRSAARPAKGQSSVTFYLKGAVDYAGQLRQTQNAWLEIPALWMPEFERKALDGGHDFKNTWHRGAALHAQVALFVAEQLTDRLARASGLKPAQKRFIDNTPPTKKKGEPSRKADNSRWITKTLDNHYITIGDGAPRWGGNHSPHFEHRDGLVFDISNPFDFLPFRMGTPPGVSTQLFAEYASLWLYRAHDPDLPSAVYPYDEVWRVFDRRARKGTGGWLNSPLDAHTIDQVAANLWGSPVHGSAASPESDPLQHNLLGHVALILSGVKRWVYAGAIQHVYALGIVIQVLGKVAPKLLLEQALKADFWCGANDHYNHWHVGYPTSSEWLEPTDGRAKPVFAAYVELWKRLGLSLSPMGAFLSQRETRSNKAVEDDRLKLVELLSVEPPAIQGNEPSGDDLIKSLAQAIVARRYPEDNPPPRALKQATDLQIPDWNWQIPDPDYKPDE